MTDRAFRLHLNKVSEETPPGEFYEVRFEELPRPAAGAGEASPERPTDAAGVGKAGGEELLKFEYERAQEMLQHYDNLTWHIGSILIAGILVLTGLGLGSDGFEAVAKGWKSLVIVYGVPGISFMALSLWALWFRRMRSHYRFRDDVLHRLEAKLGMYHFLRIVEANENRKFMLDDAGVRVTLPKLPTPPASARGRAGDFSLEVAKLKDDAYQNEEPYASLCDKQKEAVRERLTEKRKRLIEKLAASRQAAWGRGEDCYAPMVDVEHAGPSSYKLVWGLAVAVPLLQLGALMTLWASSMWERANLHERLNLRPWGETYTWQPGWIWAHPIFAGILILIAAVGFGRWLKDEF